MAAKITTNFLVANFGRNYSKLVFFYFMLVEWYLPETHLASVIENPPSFPLFLIFLSQSAPLVLFYPFTPKCWCSSWFFAWLPSLLSLHTFFAVLNYLYSFDFTYVPKFLFPTLATLLTTYKIFTTASGQELHRHFRVNILNMEHLSKYSPLLEIFIMSFTRQLLRWVHLSHKYDLNKSLPLKLYHSPSGLVLDSYDALKIILFFSSTHPLLWPCLSVTNRKISKGLPDDWPTEIVKY